MAKGDIIKPYFNNPCTFKNQSMVTKVINKVFIKFYIIEKYGGA